MQTIANYLDRMERYKNAGYRIKDGVGYYLVDGKEISEDEWRSNNPIPIHLPRTPNGDLNPDRTKLWQYD